MVDDGETDIILNNFENPNGERFKVVFIDHNFQTKQVLESMPTLTTANSIIQEMLDLME